MMSFNAFVEDQGKLCSQTVISESVPILISNHVIWTEFSSDSLNLLAILCTVIINLYKIQFFLLNLIHVILHSEIFHNL